MKLEIARYEAIKADLRAYAAAKGVTFPVDSRSIWGLFYGTRQDRAYDDKHPNYRSGRWTRVLPYGGSDYCSFYEQPGINDEHITTALRRANDELGREEVASYADAAA